MSAGSLNNALRGMISRLNIHADIPEAEDLVNLPYSSAGMPVFLRRRINLKHAQNGANPEALLYNFSPLNTAGIGWVSILIPPSCSIFKV